MANTLTLSFEHTPVGMKVWFKDHMGVWHPLETATYMGDTPDAVREEFAYINTLRAIRPTLGIHVEQHRYH